MDRKWRTLIVVSAGSFTLVLDYYAGHDPRARGIDIARIIVLGRAALLLTALAAAAIERRELRA